MGNVASKYMKSLCKRHATAKIFLDCAGRPRELIESLQKKVRKGQVSGTSSLFVPTQCYARVQQQECHAAMYHDVRTARQCTEGRLYARVQMYWDPNKKKRFMTNCS